MRAHIPIVTLMLLLTPVVVPGLTSATVNAEVIYVCWDGSGDYLTIQEGIDAASDGDEVVVCDGTYTGPLNKNLDFGGKAITVRSANGPETCIIDCQEDGRGFHFQSGETSASVVDGFTITNGNAGSGGGLYCRESSPTIRNCVITGNRAVNGGGINCYIDSDLTISNCTIAGNTASDRGGGVVCTRSSPTITNSTIAGNMAAEYGGGVYGYRSNVTITNCTITENAARRYGGGAVYLCYDNPVITNCILWGDAGPQGPEIALADSCTLTVAYCDVQGGELAAYVEDGSTLVWGDGNIDADPGFSFEDDTHLMPASPCVDAGTNEPPGGLPPHDPDGNPRPLDGDGDSFAIADMGAYEFNPGFASIACSPGALVFFVTEGGPNPEDQSLSIRNCGGGTLDWEIFEQCPWLAADPTTGQSEGEIDEVALSVDGNGLARGSYTCALDIVDSQAVNSPRTLHVTLNVGGVLHVPAEYPTIQAAIDATEVPGDVVLVADGVYTGEGNKNLDFGGKTLTVRSVNGAQGCVIDCEGDGRGFSFGGGVPRHAVVDGFTITNGNAIYGGGISCRGFSSPTISNCTITGNVANPNFGGGISCSRASPLIINCTIADNAAEASGGGFDCDESAPTIVNCVIAGNVAHSRGAGVYCYWGSVTLTNCTIIDNKTDGRGGGVACWRDSSATIANCILWGNSAAQGAEICVGYVGRPSTLTVSYCDVEGGESGAYIDDGCTLNWGEGNIDADPAFAFADDYHLASGSPCIDAGTNDPAGGLPTDDFDGNPRPLDGDGDSIATADMGTYEFNPDAPSIACSPAAFEFFAPEGGPNTHDQILCIRNCGGETLNWDISEECPWLDVDPASGQSTGEIDEVTVSVDVDGLSRGQYTCVLAVADPQAVNSPRQVVVTLNVYGTLHVPSEYSTIQDAIDAAVVPGDVVLVADGTYTGPGNTDLDFAGRLITVRSENGPDNCIIDCKGISRGFYFHSGETAAAVVDGFTITNAYADHGAGVHCVNSSPTLMNCLITGNTAYSGGGILCWRSWSKINNCVITGNWASGSSGGAVSCSGGALIITNCTIAENTAATQGGGVSCGPGSLMISNCTIAENTVGEHWGGGVFSEGGDLTITNCTIAGNTAENAGGGGVACLYGSATISNCTITGNTADDYGGAFFCRDNDPTITNCVLWANAAPQGPEIAVKPGPTTLTVSYSDVQGGEAAAYVAEDCELIWGPGNIDADPLFVDPDGPDDDPNTWEDNDYRLSGGSPCIDAGCNWSVPPDVADLDEDGDTSELTPLDVDGEGRFFDDPDTPNYGCCGEGVVVDMGAYEFGETGPQPCPGDLNGDQMVGHSDLAILLAAWHLSDEGDLDCDGVTGHSDLGILLGHWGEGCP